ncbi:MAG TPA: DNA polymerase IV [Candidatus Nanoarchaeia archaeon]|nr:DNA polymerase IV [uncultured archaeon]
MPRASWMHLDLDCFFAAVEIKLNPSLLGKTVLVGRVNPQGKSVPRGVVATASYEARIFGCKSGMPLYQALKLCPSAIVIGGHYEEYIKASDQVFQIAARWAPKVERVSIDEAFLDFSSTEVIYPDLTKIAQKIRAEVKKEVGITASIGLASTKVCAKVASDFNKPDGFCYVPAGSERKFLAPLPLRDLPGIGAKTEVYFKQLGLGTVGDLARLSHEKIESLGQFPLGLWNAANGRDNIWFVPRVTAKSVSRSETFYTDRGDENFILAMLRKLAESSGEEMRVEGYSGRCVHVVIRYKDFRMVGRQRVLPYFTSSTKEIYDLGETLLKELWDRRTPLRLVGIEISQFGESSQLSLFDAPREKRLGLEKRIDNLRARFGKDAVVPAIMLNLQPERTGQHLAIWGKRK